MAIRRILSGIRRRLQFVSWGSLRRLEPVDRSFGFERGKPIDRYYIEKFLRDNESDVKGRVLEMGNSVYTKPIGGDRVTHPEVLSPVATTPGATIIGDLATGEGIPKNHFDCILLIQTLPFIYDTNSVIKHVYEALSENGVVLVTTSGISKISPYDMERWGDYWRFTRLSLKMLFEKHFKQTEITVQSYGNILSATGFLYGLAAHELKEKELLHQDLDYEVTVALRAVKR